MHVKGCITLDPIVSHALIILFPKVDVLSLLMYPCTYMYASLCLSVHMRVRTSVLVPVFNLVIVLSNAITCNIES